MNEVNELEFYKNLATLQGLALHYAVSEYADSSEEMATEVNRHLERAQEFQKVFAQTDHQKSLALRVAQVLSGEVLNAY
ncbi:MAG: hypothetical protein MH252_08350 [Thermosynechococcaceae cyanobacterium MS004]|nr:hypothetical protein [Thermosynechococcaceae cyanobacterium MS004]